MDIDTIVIEVPDMNDSFSRVMLQKTVYYLRFTWLDTQSRWMFGLYTDHYEPIYQGIAIVPNYPLNLFTGVENAPVGVFHVRSEKAVIGREDFKKNVAYFCFSCEVGA